MLQHYETVFIVDPVLPDEEIEGIFNKFASLIQENGKIITKEHWGSRQLSYPINKKNTGIYFLIEFETPSDFIKKLEIQYKRHEKIMRFLTLKMDKYAIEYAEKVRNKKEEEPIAEINEETTIESET